MVGVSEHVLTSQPLPTGLHGFMYLGFGFFKTKLSAHTVIPKSRTRSGPAYFTTSIRASNTLFGCIVLPFGKVTLIFCRLDEFGSSVGVIISPVAIDTKSTFNPSSNSSDIFNRSSLFGEY